MTPREPNLSDVPRILFRTVFRFLARIVFTVAGFFLMVGFGLAYSSVLIATFRSSRTPKVQTVVNFVLAAYALVEEFRTDKGKSVTQTDSL